MKNRGAASGILTGIFTLAAMALPASAQAEVQKGDWVTRGNFMLFAPFGEEEYSLFGAPTAVGGSGDEFADTSSIGFSADGVYFFTDHFAFQMSLGYIQSAETELTFNDGVQTFETNGKVRHFTTAVALQYHIAPYGEINPYIGAGVYYDFVHSSLEGIEFDNTGGPLVHVGADWWFGGYYGMNLEIEKQWMTTDADYSELLQGLPLTSEVDFDPWVFSVGFSYKF